MSILQPFYDAVAWLIVHIHDVLGDGSGASWVVSIVVLTLLMRICLIPLFVKQIRSQRRMMVVQPQMKALQKKYANDKQKLNEELTKLYKETGFNPLTGCLPMIAPFPIFIALFHTLDKLKPTACSATVKCLAGHSYAYVAITGFTSAQVKNAANSKIFGVPIAAAFNSNSTTIRLLNGSLGSTRILCAILTVIMVATTFLTQKQMQARNSANQAPGDNPMAQQQKIMLYVLPLFFLFYGYRFPVGLLFYWLTTNLWTMGQQFFVLRRMDQPAAVAAGSVIDVPTGPAPGAKPDRAKPSVTPPGPKILPVADGPTAPRGPSPRRPTNDPRNRSRKKRRR